MNYLGNFKQKKFYTSKCKFFFTFYNNRPIIDKKFEIEYVSFTSYVVNQRIFSHMLMKILSNMTIIM